MRTDYSDFIGKQYNRWTILEIAGKTAKRQVLVKCRCNCGKEKVTRLQTLINEKSKSCGCLISETQIKRMTTHGLKDHPLFMTWMCMKQRCYSVKYHAYHRYGGRGIKVYKEWLLNFKAFYDWAIGNGWQDGLTIDRINCDGDYEPTNCRWATTLEQQSNTSRNIFATHEGQTKCINQWSKILKISFGRIMKGIEYGLTIEQIISKPPFMRYNKLK